MPEVSPMSTQGDAMDSLFYPERGVARLHSESRAMSIAASVKLCSFIGVAVAACVPLPGADTSVHDEAGEWAQREQARLLREGHVQSEAEDDTAEDVFRARCKSCHGEDGKHQTTMAVLRPMPDLTDPSWQAKRSDSDIREIICKGSTRPGFEMLGFGHRLTAAEVDMLVPYVRHFNGQ
jgi:mono/diheme cytochrome c family protein